MCLRERENDGEWKRKRRKKKEGGKLIKKKKEDSRRNKKPRAAGRGRAGRAGRGLYTNKAAPACLIPQTDSQ